MQGSSFECRLEISSIIPRFDRQYGSVVVTQAKITEFNKALKRLARKYEFVYFHRTLSQFRDCKMASESQRQDLHAFGADHLHLRLAVIPVCVP